MRTEAPKLWSEFMEELRHLHLEAPAPRGSVFSRLQVAYEAAIAKPIVSMLGQSVVPEGMSRRARWRR